MNNEKWRNCVYNIATSLHFHILLPVLPINKTCLPVGRRTKQIKLIKLRTYEPQFQKQSHRDPLW